MPLLLGLLVVAAAFGVGFWVYSRSAVPGLREYSRVVGGMSVEEVRRVMGRQEDEPEGRATTTGELERSRSFDGGVRYTVVFDKNGRSTYKELAPSDCGVTPLMEKYVEKD